jgi:MATE family multidrug resistance protein
MGVEGAAWATLLSRWIMTIMGMTYVRYSNLMKSYIIEGRMSFWETRKYTHEIWKIGIPIALQTFAEWACFALSGIMVGWFGNDPLAAHAVALNAASVTYMIVTGIATAGSIFTGNAFGERNYFKIKHLGQITLILILAFEIINAVLFIILNKPIAQLYRVEESVLPYILPLFFLASIFQVADGIQAGAMALLRGVKDVRWASVISMVSYWAISLPLSYLLGVILEDGVYGVWLGLTIGLFVAAIFGVIRFYKNVNKWEVAN